MLLHWSSHSHKWLLLRRQGQGGVLSLHLDYTGKGNKGWCWCSLSDKINWNKLFLHSHVFNVHWYALELSFFFKGGIFPAVNSINWFLPVYRAQCMITADYKDDDSIAICSEESVPVDNVANKEVSPCFLPIRYFENTLLSSRRNVVNNAAHLNEKIKIMHYFIIADENAFALAACCVVAAGWMTIKSCY